ncbi:MAG: hypothetical protein JO303_05675 [Caulobacteraceae bacterium]|nr:hypothetical protein [Caulobacteraceae bacterium]
METSELREPFERMIAGEPDWATLAESGFLDALVPETAGGAGLSLAQAGPLIHVLGYHACALPAADTMVARALLAEAGQDAPDGPIVLASSVQPPPLAETAAHLLYDDGDGLKLGEAGAVVAPQGGLRPVAALVAAGEIAGAAERMFEMSIAYANDRVQFGKPIGRQQAIQHNLAIMAEQVLMTRMAAQIGWAAGLHPTPLQAAAAKHTASAAVQTLSAVAHATHGAIGVTEEFCLHRFVKLIYGRRMAHGSEAYWAKILGEARLSGPEQSSLDFVRSL